MQSFTHLWRCWWLTILISGIQHFTQEDGGNPGISSGKKCLSTNWNLGLRNVHPWPWSSVPPSLVRGLMRLSIAKIIQQSWEVNVTSIRNIGRVMLTGEKPNFTHWHSIHRKSHMDFFWDWKLSSAVRGHRLTPWFMARHSVVGRHDYVSACCPDCFVT